MRDFDFTGQNAPAATLTISAPDSGDVAVPTGIPVFTADYARAGDDLLLIDGALPVLRIESYFDSDTPADLVAANGAVLRGDLAVRLAGPDFAGQYAQVGASFGSDPIGQVETLEGTAWAERADGTRVQLQVGTKVYQNDVVSTEDGSTTSITFADGTIFTLAAASRMVLDEFVYDAGSSEGNSGAFSLIEGGFVFIAGEVAKTGGMDVETPTATMGIRGTTVLVDISTLDGITTVEVSLNVDPGGGVGSIELRDLDGNLIATLTTTDSKWIVSPVEGETREIPRTADDFAEDQTILLDAARAWATANERVDAGGTFVQLAASGPDTGEPGSTEGEGDGTPAGPDAGDGPGPGDDPPGATGGDGGGDDGTAGDTDEFGEELRGTPNQAPTAVADAVSVDEDGLAVGNLLDNDSDDDGDPIEVIAFTAPTEGALVLTETGAFSYTPAEDFFGTDSFTYTISDGNGETSTATVTITVDPVNDPPAAEDDSASGTEDNPITGNVLDNDSDIDGGALSVTGNSEPANGTVTVGENGAFTYTPDEHFHGTDSFSYTVDDGAGGSDTAIVTLTVTPVNDAPTATDDAAQASEDGPAVGIDLTGNDTDLDASDDLGIDSLNTAGTLGSVTIDEGGDGVSYDPNGAFEGLAAGETAQDTFSYTVSDGNGGTDTATVTVTVTGENDAPVAVDDSFSGDEDGEISGNAFANDSDPDGDGIVLQSASDPSHGWIWWGFAGGEEGEEGLEVEEVSGLATDGTFYYYPDPDFFGTDSFTYTISDENGGTDTATVTITVNPVNDPPEAQDDSGSGDEDTQITGNVLGNDTDIDSATLSVIDNTDPSNGSVTVGTDGAYTYTPDDDFNGTDSFSYTVSDGNGGTDTATVTLTVDPVNDDPVGTDDSGAGDEDTQITGNVLGNDSDVDGDDLMVTGNTAPLYGTLVIAADGAFTYTPYEDFNGADSFSYTVSDGEGGSDTATVALTVNPVNDAPVATDEAIEVEAEIPYSGQIGVTDVDSASFSYSVATDPENGSLTLETDGSYTYTPDEDFSGFDRFEVLVDDGAGGTDTATIIVEVGTEEYDAPSGQSVSIGISGEAVGDAPIGNVAIDVTAPQPNTINVSFVLDSSGSIGSTGWSQQINAVAGALADLAAQFADALTTVNVQIVSYSAAATGFGTTDPYDLVEDAAALNALVTGLPFQASTTNWEAALDTAFTFFDGQNPAGSTDTNFLYFITDGNPFPSTQDWQGSVTDIRQASWDVDILTFGIGSGYNPNLLTIDLPFDGTDGQSDFDEDGVVTQVSVASDLTGAIASTSLFAAELVEFSLGLVADGVDEGEIATEADLALDGTGLNYDLPLADVAGIADLIGEENLFTAVATFDLDGDPSTTGDQVTLVSNEAINKATTARTETGTEKNDLILGSDAADDLAGGLGDDVIFGFGGDDILIDDAGSDILRGGAGRDTVEVLASAAAGSDLLPTLAGSDIEEIDIDNGANEALDVSLADVVALSDTADTELETLLARALGDSATILGNTGDEVTLGFEETGEWQQTGTVSDGAGTTLVVYDFVSAGEVLATLGIDDDVTVYNLAATA